MNLPRDGVYLMRELWWRLRWKKSKFKLSVAPFFSIYSITQLICYPRRDCWYCFDTRRTPTFITKRQNATNNFCTLVHSGRLNCVCCVYIDCGECLGGGWAKQEKGVCGIHSRVFSGNDPINTPNIRYKLMFSVTIFIIMCADQFTIIVINSLIFPIRWISFQRHCASHHIRASQQGRVGCLSLSARGN